MKLTSATLLFLVLASLCAAPATAAKLVFRAPPDIGPDHVCVVSGSIACVYTPYHDLNGHLCVAGVGAPDDRIGVVCTRSSGACAWEERIRFEDGPRDIGFVCVQALQTAPNGDFCAAKVYVITDSASPEFVGCIGSLA